MKQQTRHRNRGATAGLSGGARRGFTLIELMVSVALAIMVLGMFAAIYRWTTEIYSQQKGNRRNDQKSRMLTTMIKADLELRTFREIVPYEPGQHTGSGSAYPDALPPPDFSLENRAGYFAISENDPKNQTDDVLAFTIQIHSSNTELRPFTAKATMLFNPAAIDPRTGNPYTDDATGWQRYLIDHPNQPEFDDGIPALTRTGTSRSAEVVYFVRNGNLYRRLLLIREQYNGPASNITPTEITNKAVSPGIYSADITRDPNTSNQRGTGNFWDDFDYSAYYKFTGSNVGLKFHGTASLVNTNPPSVVDPDFNYPRILSIPHLRYGHSLNRGVLPQEYDKDGKFIGRFLAQETADPNFGYPGNSTAATDPHTRTDLTLNTSRGIIDQYNTVTPPPRRGDDLVMTNVHEFDIKVWDAVLQRFVDLGHDETDSTGTRIGEYNANQNRRGWNATNGTLNYRWNRFDTWTAYQDSTLGVAPYKKVVPNERLGSPTESPLQAIQITIRFLDIPTQKMRQLTIVHRFVAQRQ